MTILTIRMFSHGNGKVLVDNKEIAGVQRISFQAGQGQLNSCVLYLEPEAVEVECDQAIVSEIQAV